MRIIVYGVGAIGGTVAALLSLSGYSVVGIARGRQLEAIRSDGLRLHTPTGTRTARFPVVSDPEEITFGADDFVLLTMKGQDTPQALLRLKSTGVVEQPIFCFQNGVANELLALRFFENVYGVTVMLPADYDTPGEVAAYGAPKIGIFDIGRYPAGSDDTVERLCQALDASGFVTNPRNDVMSSKYRKLLLNLHNIVEVVLSDQDIRGKWRDRLRTEGEAVLSTAGIEWDKSDALARKDMTISTIPGRKRIGSSTLQSAVRGTGSLETDYLNGEIVLLGRLNNVATPVNAAFCRLSAEIASGRMKPQSATDEAVSSVVDAVVKAS